MTRYDAESNPVGETAFACDAIQMGRRKPGDPINAPTIDAL